ncbi:MAG TPA: NADH-quinone oxidoreductase subunit N [Bacteroidota bacterium]|nr:NADH-quinone oxidoreductase subunit N [Bacteroidota bacterium]
MSEMPLKEIGSVAPVAIVLLTSLIVILLDALKRNAALLTCWLAGLGLACALVAAYAGIAPGNPPGAFGGMLSTGGFANFFSVVFCASGILCVLLSKAYIERVGIAHGEYYGLILFAVAGMMLMAGAADLMVFFIGLELMSVSFYVLAGFARGILPSNEAALKYFLLGAFATGFLLYGIALIYGATASTALDSVLRHAPSLAHSPVFLIGLALLSIGLMFKVAAVPFHMWVPDVYEGAPTTVSAFMSTGGKAAAFAGFLLVFKPLVFTTDPTLREVLAVVSAISMVAGNVIAIAQTSVKRMLAYSSIAHAGYILTGVVAANSAGTNGVLFYLMSYTLMNVGAFGVVSLLERGDGTMLKFDDCAGLSRRSPLIAALTALFMFSLAGIPPFAGFFGKYYVFTGAVEAGFTWLAIVGVLMSAVSVYYYLRLVVLMYFSEQEGGSYAPVQMAGLAALVIAAIALIGFGVFPSTLLGLTTCCF